MDEIIYKCPDCKTIFTKEQTKLKQPENFIWIDSNAWNNCNIGCYGNFPHCIPKLETI